MGLAPDLGPAVNVVPETVADIPEAQVSFHPGASLVPSPECGQRHTWRCFEETIMTSSKLTILPELRGEGNRSPGISWHSHAGPGGHENRSLTPLSYGPPKGLFLVIKGTSQLFKVSYTLDMAPKPCPGILDSPILRVRGACRYGSWEMWPVCIQVCYLSG